MALWNKEENLGMRESFAKHLEKNKNLKKSDFHTLRYPNLATNGN